MNSKRITWLYQKSLFFLDLSWQQWTCVMYSYIVCTIAGGYLYY